MVHYRPGTHSARNLRELKLAIPILFLVAPTLASAADADALRDYVLGPRDKLAITATGLEEKESPAVRIDPAGNIDVGMAGTVHAAGLTVSDLRALLTDRFRKFLQEPKVMVDVVEFSSQTVTVTGAVDKPGAQQFEGPKRLLDLIALAGGLTKTAGTKIAITRYQESGPLPLPGARQDLSAGCSVGEVDIEQLTAKADPAVNIVVRSGDVIAVQLADLIYVIGEVYKPGGFAIDSHMKVTVMDVLAMAGGAKVTASPKEALVLRVTGEGNKRERIRPNVAKIMDGKAPDILLQPEDILMIPNSKERAVRLKAIDAVVPIVGIEIYRVSVTGSSSTTTSSSKTTP